MAPSAAAKDEGCAELRALVIGINAVAGYAAGAGAAVISSVVIYSSNEDREYSFGNGAWAGISTTAALTTVYWITEAASGCAMMQSTGDDVMEQLWVGPVMVVVGTAMPVVVWQRSDKRESTGEVAAPLAQATWHFSW